MSRGYFHPHERTSGGRLLRPVRWDSADDVAPSRRTPAQCGSSRLRPQNGKYPTSKCEVELEYLIEDSHKIVSGYSDRVAELLNRNRSILLCPSLDLDLQDG